jgi:multisubunit Na+/H+ antiporter MnhE subunit
MKRNSILRVLLIGSLESAFLFLLWMLFVSQLRWHEACLGIAAAVLGSIADARLKAQHFTPFKPRLRWLTLVLWEPWYALTGTAAVLKALVRHLLGRRSEAQFRAVRYDYGGDDEVSSAKRALFVAYMTIVPNFIVVGIDNKTHLALIHQVSPTDTPKMGRLLGAEE